MRWIMALLALLVVFDAKASEETRIPARGADLSLPYTPYLRADVRLPLRNHQFQTRGYTLLDFDGDGGQELVRHSAMGIELKDEAGGGVFTHESTPLPVGYRSRTQLSDMVPYDPDDDGRQAVAVVSRHQTGERWGVFAIDVGAGEILGSVELPVFEGRVPEDGWDGFYSAVGQLEVPGRPRPAVLLSCFAGYDVQGRGLLAVDPLEGIVVWRLMLDDKIVGHRTTTADLDGDGRQEIITGTAACNNLGGDSWFSEGDHRSRLLVVGADGRIRWQRDLAGRGYSSFAKVADLDGDQRPEIIVHTNGPGEPPGWLSVWSSEGELLERRVFTEVPFRPRGMVVTSAPGESTLVHVLFGRERLVSLVWKEGAFQKVRSRSLGANQLMAMDIVPEIPGPELMTADHQGLVILDQDLNTLAAMESGRFGPYVFPDAWTADSGLVRLMAGVEGVPTVYLDRSPDRDLRLVAAGSAAVGLILAGSLITWRRRLLRKDGLERNPAILRELRLQLMGRLAKGNHGKIGLLKSLRGFLWTLEAEVVNGLMEETPGGNSLEGAALVQGRERLRKDTLPGIREIVALGQRTGAPPYLPSLIEKVLQEVEDQLNRRDLSASGLQEGLAGLDDELEIALRRLRQWVDGCFSADLAPCVRETLVGHAEDIAEMGIAVSVEGDERLKVAMDRRDLDFIVDNLIENAVRSMARMKERRLRVAWEESQGRVLLVVEDSGCGIAEDDWEDVFEEGWSTRPGGGYGLARSRQEAELYGGSLKIRRSAPGRGTTMVLVLGLGQPEAPVGSASG